MTETEHPLANFTDADLEALLNRAIKITVVIGVNLKIPLVFLKLSGSKIFPFKSLNFVVSLVLCLKICQKRLILILAV